MNVYLIKICDRPDGFTVRAVVTKTEEDAKRITAARCRCYFGTWMGPEYKSNHSHAEVVDSCPATEGRSCFMEFQE